MLSAISIRKRWRFSGEINLRGIKDNYMFKINEDKMPEAEVSLRLAFYLINEELVNSDVHVSIDGAQIETNEKTHFDIRGFLKCEGWIKEEDSLHLFYGTYSKLNYKKNWNSNFAS